MWGKQIFLLNTHNIPVVTLVVIYSLLAEKSIIDGFKNHRRDSYMVHNETSRICLPQSGHVYSIRADTAVTFRINDGQVAV